jgi:hypothetical protein
VLGVEARDVADAPDAPAANNSEAEAAATAAVLILGDKVLS